VTTGDVFWRVLAAVLVTVGVCTPRVVQSQVQPAAATASISGRVLAGDTGAPVRGAMVTLTPLTGPPSTVATTDDGGFTFADLQAGRYMLGVSKTGFLSTFFDHRGPSTEYFEVRAGQTIDRLECRLPKAGVISGRIFDTYGDPMSEITVTAWRTDYVAPGERRLAQARSTQTNDLGDYRLFNLPAGRYYVAAGSLPPLLAPGAPRPVMNYASGNALALTFYPGTAIGADALPITVRNNEEQGGTNIRLHAVRFSRVSGIVRDSTGRPAANVFVMFNPSRADGAVLTLGAGGTVTDPTGNFVVPDVPPGDYRIDVVPKAKLDATAEGTAGMWLVQGESASVPLTVAGERLIELTIDLTPGRRITGRLLVDNQPLEQTGRSKPQVVAFPLVPGSTPTALLHTVATTPGPDGVFTLSGVHGPRLIRVYGPPTLSLQRVIAGGLDVTDRVIEIGSEDIQVEI
jgi:hypothetical protein